MHKTHLMERLGLEVPIVSAPLGRAPIMSLLPAVVDAAGGLPVAAAGGIADGRGPVPTITDR